MQSGGGIYPPVMHLVKTSRSQVRGKKRKKGGKKTMKNVTRPDDLNKYYLYKGHFITRDRRDGMYRTYTSKGCLMADTQKGIKKLINEEVL